MMKQTQRELSKLSSKYGFEFSVNDIHATPFKVALIPVDSIEEKERIIRILNPHKDWWYEEEKEGCISVMESREHDALDIDIKALCADFEKWMISRKS